MPSKLVYLASAATPSQLVALAVAVFVVASFLSTKPRPKVAGAPYYGYRSFFEPSVFLQFRFSTDGPGMIDAAYKKLKNVPYVIRRYDTDITVLPMKYIDEIRVIPRRKLNLWKAQIGNVVPRWTWTHTVLDSNLHLRALSNRLNPELGNYLAIAHDELDYGWSTDLPQSHDWNQVDIQHSLRMLIARTTARVFMGKLACRQQKWLETTMSFSVDLWLAAFTLRMFPTWMYPIVAHFIPARWRIRKELGVAKGLVAELTDEHMAAIKDGEKPEDTILGWMIDHGSEKETSISEMASLQCILALLGIHTVSATITTILFDLCSHPEWFPVLREEIDHVTASNGHIGQGSLNHKLWLAKLEKMDSFITESQRVQPQILLNPQRIALEPLTLEDGTKIPAGTRIGFAGHQHANDPSLIDDPERFDPLRNYRKRHDGDDAADTNKFIAVQPNSGAMSFGYGTQSCPGRYFSVGEIKLVLMRLISEFEFQFPEGQSKPANGYADEMVFMDHNAQLMMKKRPAVVA